MNEKLEITLRIVLDRSGLAKRLHRIVEDDYAFFIFGLVNAQLSSTFGEEHCRVELESASGVSKQLIEAMNVLPVRVRQTLQSLQQNGQAVVTDADVLAAVRELEGVTIMDMNGKWLVLRPGSPGDLSTPGNKSMKH